MDKMIARFPGQLTEALQLAQRVSLKKHSAPFRSILICGMGGSGIGGNFVQELGASSCKVPIQVCKSYQIPGWVNKNTLAICSSYSGNTEETLAAFEQLRATGAKIVCVASGGKLLDLAKKHDCDFVTVPGGWSSPRACVGYSIVLQLAVLHSAKLIRSRIFSQIDSARKRLEKEQATLHKQAQKIAAALAGKTPVLYCSDQMETVALRWRQQINENAKLLCWHHVLPEMNHNELVGWHDPSPALAAIWLRNGDDFPRTATRIDITREIAARYAGASLEVYSKGKSPVEKMLYLVHLGDWVSYYLALQRGVDPVEIQVIDFLKGELAKV